MSCNSPSMTPPPSQPPMMTQAGQADSEAASSVTESVDSAKEDDDLLPPAALLPATLDPATMSVRDLIMSAIGVMKSRKARPDTKRISNWIHRRYGRPISDVQQELERLVTVGELARVDYKGSSSFRIVSLGAKARRKRRTGKPLGRIPSNNPLPLGGVLPAMCRSSESESGAPLTLHTLVLEMMGDASNSNLEKGLTIHTKLIAKAVESTTRSISRAVVLGNLDLLLAREVDMGLFQRIGDDLFRLLPVPPLTSTANSVATLTSASTTPQPSSPRLPLPPALPFPASISLSSSLPLPAAAPPLTSSAEQPHPAHGSVFTPANFGPCLPLSLPLSMQMSMPPSHTQAASQPLPPPIITQPPALPSVGPNVSISPVTNVNPNGMNQVFVTPETSVSFVSGTVLHPPPPPPPPGPGPQNPLPVSAPSPFAASSNSFFSTPIHHTFPPSLTVTKEFGPISKSDEQIKNDLIRCQLSKMSATSSGSSSKSASKKCAGAATCAEIPAKKKGPRDQASPSDNSVLKRTRKSAAEPSNQNDDLYVEKTEAADEARDEDSTARSGRKKKSRKIFDPADHDLPFRRRRASASPVEASECCHICKGKTPQHKSGSLPSNAMAATLIQCQDCRAKAHLACLNVSEAKCRKVLLTSSWQCDKCKLCVVCREVSNKDWLLVCDSCDQAYHMHCHTPSLSQRPHEPWQCWQCMSYRLTSSTACHLSPLLATSLPASTSLTVANGHSSCYPQPFYLNNHTNVVPCYDLPVTSTILTSLPVKWESLEADLMSLDASSWLPHHVGEYFAKQGFAPEICKTFVEQEVDGKSLLLMGRNDVISGLGIKLGPALKVFNHVRKLQLGQSCQSFP